MKRHRGVLLVAAVAATLVLTGCLNSITLGAADIEDEGSSAEITGPETVVSAAGGAEATEIDTVVDGATNDDGSTVEAPYIADGAGGRIEGFALDEFKIADAIERKVNDYRTDGDSTMMGRQRLRDSGSLSVAAREQSRRMARNVIRLYSSEAGDDEDVLDAMSGGSEENREMRFIRHNAAECNSNLKSLDREHESIHVLTAQIPTSGENITAITYDELAAHLGGPSTGVSAEERIASAAVEVLKTDEGVTGEMLNGEYRYQGVGVKNVPSEGVLIVTQDYC